MKVQCTTTIFWEIEVDDPETMGEGNPLNQADLAREANKWARFWKEAQDEAEVWLSDNKIKHNHAFEISMQVHHEEI